MEYKSYNLFNFSLLTVLFLLAAPLYSQDDSTCLEPFWSPCNERGPTHGVQIFFSKDKPIGWSQTVRWKYKQGGPDHVIIYWRKSITFGNLEKYESDTYTTEVYGNDINEHEISSNTFDLEFLGSGPCPFGITFVSAIVDSSINLTSLIYTYLSKARQLLYEKKFLEVWHHIQKVQEIEPDNPEANQIANETRQALNIYNAELEEEKELEEQKRIAYLKKEREEEEKKQKEKFEKEKIKDNEKNKDEESSQNQKSTDSELNERSQDNSDEKSSSEKDTAQSSNSSTYYAPVYIDTVALKQQRGLDSIQYTYRMREMKAERNQKANEEVINNFFESSSTFLGIPGTGSLFKGDSWKINFDIGPDLLVFDGNMGYGMGAKFEFFPYFGNMIGGSLFTEGQMGYVKTSTDNIFADYDLEDNNLIKFGLSFFGGFKEAKLLGLYENYSAYKYIVNSDVISEIYGGGIRWNPLGMQDVNIDLLYLVAPTNSKDYYMGKAVFLDVFRFEMNGANYGSLNIQYINELWSVGISKPFTWFGKPYKKKIYKVKK